MSYVMQLFEDILSDGEEVRFGESDARAIYVAAGSALVEGAGVAADNGVVLAGTALVRADAGGATLWRWDVAPSGTGAGDYRHRTALRCSGPVEPATIADDLLLRLDSVAFPAGGTALLHTHRGPGIRCLKEGDIRIDTAGHSTTYCPGGAWFEEGPEPVFAQASASVPSRFIRSMVLPRALLGTSSIRYVKEADRDRPKSQSYRVFAESPVRLDPAWRTAHPAGER